MRKNRIEKKNGQQEMVGFVLIVVIVVIALMVFLVISVRQGSGDERQSLEVENLLNVIMRTTTECAPIFEPQYDTFEDLFKSCYGGEECSNLGQESCDYLNESLRNVVRDLLESEATVSAYQIDVFQKDDEGSQGILNIFEGNCTGTVSGAQRNLVVSGESLLVRMKLCAE
ncbi:hypothetical protein HOA55_00815 [archaeon]|jgi:hypothetical protein|nr:hypothetical protein [archaeon]MBT3578203.1 hypothetical protein [archaeon]MBT6819876.1 hypothetical protein [archaeon]MBT6956378.1 hypothetical protein [archaeon]MBT7025658.1 hypothetical protein [archaeon]